MWWIVGGPTCSYGASVLLGCQALLAVLADADYVAAEAIRLHAAIGLSLGVALAGLLVVGALDDLADPGPAVLLGLAGAAGTGYLLLSGPWYFSFVGEYVRPAAGAFSEVLALAG